MNCNLLLYEQTWLQIERINKIQSPLPISVVKTLLF